MSTRPGRASNDSGTELTFDLVVGPFFTVPNVNKVKCRLALGKAEREILEIHFIVQTAVLPHGLGESGKVGIDFGNYFDPGRMLSAFPEDRGSQSVGGPLATLNTLSDQILPELRRRRVRTSAFKRHSW